MAKTKTITPLAALLPYLPREDGTYLAPIYTPIVVNYGSELDSIARADLVFDAVIGLGRVGAAARPALPALRRLEGNADLPLRHAAARARDRIEAATRP